MALLYKQQMKLQEEIVKREAANDPESSVHAGVQKKIEKEEAVADVTEKKEEKDTLRQKEESTLTMQQPSIIEQSNKEKKAAKKRRIPKEIRARFAKEGKRD